MEPLRRRLVHRLMDLDAVLGSVTLVFLLVTLMVQIVLRFVFSMPFMGAEELTRYFVICVVMVPLAYAERTRSHVVMEELQALLPRGVQAALRVLIEALTTLVYIVLAASAVAVLANNLRNMTATLRMPFWLFFAPTVLGCVAIVLVRLTAVLYRIIGKETPWASPS